LSAGCRYSLGYPEEKSFVKIDSALQQVTSAQAKGIKSKRSKDKGGSSSTGAVSDNVQLTDASSLLRELETQLGEVPAEDAGKVESVRQAIADGTFVVDEEAVAEGLVKETIEQLSHRQANES